MSDLRARLTDALRESAVDRTSAVIDRQVQALLSLPGIAIVELPELALLICSGCMRYMSYCMQSPCDERAALLAAANAAESPTQPRKGSE